MRTLPILATACCLLAGVAFAQNTPMPPPATAPASRPLIAPMTHAMDIDFQGQYRKELEKNRQLRGENDSLRQQLAEYTRRGGSLVHAYCETETMSRNTAGASNDCAPTGYRCEPVSGLCRTSANDSAQCADGFLLEVDHCVPRPR
ncbi:hypothetical protein [Cognatiluteimonas telluris]|jgi:hypothetical protein|uniref:hypothetical protein n=1 Tax=Cognatiluteimonas telluris TaxID=1104775 RepID=UPI001407C9CF|nr:hypothetical protein [Lysobacter telluris]